MLLVVLPEAEERATAVVVGVLAVAVAFVFFEMADVLGYLIRPLERTLPMLHVICPLTVVKSAVRPLKTAQALDNVMGKVAFEKAAITQLQNADAFLDPFTEVTLELRTIRPLFLAFAVVVTVLELPLVLVSVKARLRRFSVQIIAHERPHKYGTFPVDQLALPVGHIVEELTQVVPPISEVHQAQATPQTI